MTLHTADGEPENRRRNNLDRPGDHFVACKLGIGNRIGRPVGRIRKKPVAIRQSVCWGFKRAYGGFSNSSPANCSTRKRSHGLSPLSERMT